ncbi:hypothetical protein LTR95_000612 [Oleoguttula sp. CCFEE 5521]
MADPQKVDHSREDCESSAAARLAAARRSALSRNILSEALFVTADDFSVTPMTATPSPRPVVTAASGLQQVARLPQEILAEIIRLRAINNSRDTAVGLQCPRPQHHDQVQAEKKRYFSFISSLSWNHASRREAAHA